MPLKNIFSKQRPRQKGLATVSTEFSFLNTREVSKQNRTVGCQTIDRFPESEKPSSLSSSNTSVGTEEIYLIQTDTDAEYQTVTELNGDRISETFQEFESQEREKGVDELNFMNNVCSLNKIAKFDKSNLLGKLEVLQRQRRKLYEMKTKNEVIRKFIFRKLGRNFENLVEMFDKIILLNCVLTYRRYTLTRNKNLTDREKVKLECLTAKQEEAFELKIYFETKKEETVMKAKQKFGTTFTKFVNNFVKTREFILKELKYCENLEYEIFQRLNYI